MEANDDHLVSDLLPIYRIRTRIAVSLVLFTVLTAFYDYLLCVASRFLRTNNIFLETTQFGTSSLINVQGLPRETTRVQ